VSPQRVVFNEPVVRAAIDKVRFPKKCPVCGARATRVSRVTVVPGKKQYLRPIWDPIYSPTQRRRMGLSLPETRTLLVPVCEDHMYSDEDYCRYRTLCMLADGLSMAMLAFALLTLGGDLWQGQTSDVWVYGVMVLAAVSFIITVTAFRSRPIESAMRIVGFDAGLQNVWLDFKNRGYRDEFLKENPMTAELVSWVLKA